MLGEMNKSLHTFALALAASLLGVADSCAQTVIDHLPYEITRSGLYVLTSDLSSPITDDTGLIVVNASNVTIDLQGHAILASRYGGSEAVGIQAYERSNLTVRNGTIDHCFIGVDIKGNGQADTNAVNPRVENLLVTNSIEVGVSLGNTPAGRITGCVVVQTGSLGNFDGAVGIGVTGAGILVENNVVDTVQAAETATEGVHVNGDAFVRRNIISHCYYGVVGGKYQNNLTNGCNLAAVGGTDAGGNN